MCPHPWPNTSAWGFPRCYPLPIPLPQTQVWCAFPLTSNMSVWAAPALPLSQRWHNVQNEGLVRWTRSQGCERHYTLVQALHRCRITLHLDIVLVSCSANTPSGTGNPQHCSPACSSWTADTEVMLEICSLENWDDERRLQGTPGRGQLSGVLRNERTMP